MMKDERRKQVNTKCFLLSTIEYDYIMHPYYIRKSHSLAGIHRFTSWSSELAGSYNHKQNCIATT